MFIVPVTRSVTRVNGHARDFGAFDRLVDDAFDRFFGGSRAGTPAEARAPAIDVVETESQYTVTVDLPGVAREDVKVSIDGKRVSIEAQAGTSAEKKDGERVVYSERPAARFARSFTLPLEIDQAASQAKLDNGAMIALAAAMRLQAGLVDLAGPQGAASFDVRPRWPLDAIGIASADRAAVSGPGAGAVERRTLS